MDELQNFKLDDLYEKLSLDDENFQDSLAEIGLLHASRTCNCGSPMKKELDGHGVLQWRCNRAMHRPSRPTLGFKMGTFFEESRLDFKTIFKLSYLWRMNLPLEYAEFETEVGHRHVVKGHIQ